MRQSVELLRSLLLIFRWTLQLRTERISFRKTKMRDRSPFIRMLSILFYTIAALALFSGFWSVIQGYQWMKMVRRHSVRHPGFYAPRVALICPCKGMEPGLESNLRALVSQDYGSYEVFFVLARSEDSASSLVRKIAQSSAVPAHVVIAGAAHNCGEKVNNLRVAVEQVPADFEIFAFADSDGRPGRQWLARLVAPLSDARLGAATTYRWTLPDRGGFWSALGAAWDASIVTMLGEHAHNFCWGGGTAIRRSVFETTNISEYWKGALSDDWAITRALQSAGRQIVFVPEKLNSDTTRHVFAYADRIHEPANYNHARLLAEHLDGGRDFARRLLRGADFGRSFDCRCDRGWRAVASGELVDVRVDVVGRGEGRVALASRERATTGVEASTR